MHGLDRPAHHGSGARLMGRPTMSKVRGRPPKIVPVASLRYGGCHER